MISKKNVECIWNERKANTGVLANATYKRSIMKTHKKADKNVQENPMLCGNMQGKRNKVKQRRKFIDSLNNYTTTTQSTASS